MMESSPYVRCFSSLQSLSNSASLEIFIKGWGFWWRVLLSRARVYIQMLRDFVFCFVLLFCFLPGFHHVWSSNAFAKYGELFLFCKLLFWGVWSIWYFSMMFWNQGDFRSYIWANTFPSDKVEACFLWADFNNLLTAYSRSPELSFMVHQICGFFNTSHLNKRQHCIVWVAKRDRFGVVSSPWFPQRFHVRNLQQEQVSGPEESMIIMLHGIIFNWVTASFQPQTNLGVEMAPHCS